MKGDSETKFIIFTEFLETQKYIGEVLKNLDYTVTFFNGNMSLEEKIEAKTKFKENVQVSSFNRFWW